jgi:hypothetical protein
MYTRLLALAVVASFLKPAPPIGQVVVPEACPVRLRHAGPGRGSGPSGGAHPHGVVGQLHGAQQAHLVGAWALVEASPRVCLVAGADELRGLDGGRRPRTFAPLL